MSIENFPTKQDEGNIAHDWTYSYSYSPGSLAAIMGSLELQASLQNMTR